MNLNGQCEKAFNEWYELSEHHGKSKGTTEQVSIEATIERSLCFFHALHHDMQHGVKVKFFDSVGIYLETAWIPEMGGFGILINSVLTDDKEIRPRTETQHKAEQKANDIYNENN